MRNLPKWALNGLTATAFGLSASLLMGNGAATANETPVVVELFTSQGCSSCPPADALIAELALQGNVIALSLHVDYWDYIGWKDQFAQPKFTTRQKAYAQAAGHSTIYTPQIVVQGRDHVVGNKPMKLAELIQTHSGAPHAAPVQLDVTRQNDTLSVYVAPRSDNLPDEIQIHLVRFEDLERIEIKRGENAGQTIDYANVVTSWETVATWDGLKGHDFSFEINGDSAVVVLLQSENTVRGGQGPILAASLLR